MVRRIVGIDLGTTHTVVAWAERLAGAEPRIFDVPQLVTATEIEARPLFPSKLYAPLPGEVAADPWGDAPFVLGELARRRGSEVPGRLVASAKSWLCHGAVDRLAPILPWSAGDEVLDFARISPVEAATRVLGHVRAAWDAAHPDHPLAAQEVVLTVPASFDEVARELTVGAARAAGLSVRLLEEPQAAFYDCMAHAAKAELAALGATAGGAVVLVCDVGGGTTDLSLIRVEGQAVERVAVGPHVLLGGDNMDLALAHRCEARLVPPARGDGAAQTPVERLDAARFGQLVLACRAAKERLLGDDAPAEVPVTVVGPGARLVGSTRSTALTRAEVEAIVLDGFLPVVGADAKPQRARGGLVAFGLPYERDGAITRHVAAFFRRHAPEVAAPHALLLNGGVFRARAIVERLVATVGRWGPSPPLLLPMSDPDLAVARGAVVYGLALAGFGRRIEGGTPFGYYVGVRSTTGDEARTAICVVPRGAKEGVRHVAERRPLALVVGRPVRFDLFASDLAPIHEPGEVVAVDDEIFQALPPVAVTFDDEAPAGDGRSASRASSPPMSRRAPPRPRGREVTVALEGELTAVGTLDLSCVEIEPAEGEAGLRRRHRLAFQLRPASADDEGARPTGRPTATEPPPKSRGAKILDEALAAVLLVFGRGQREVDPRGAKGLVRELERLLGERATWTTDVSRALFDAVANDVRSRKRSADHERVFWMLAGYCLRPGFGHPDDPARVAVVAPLFAERLAFGAEARCWQQFWIAWRRVAGGLDEAAQVALRDGIDPYLAPAERKLKKPKGPRPEAQDDMLEAASALERVPASRRSELGGWVLERTWTDRDPRLWAAIGRLGARVPAYASVHHVISPMVAERWLDHLLREKWAEVGPSGSGPGRPPAFAAAQLARVTGDRARDVSEGMRAEVAKRLEAVAAPVGWVRATRELVVVEADERAGWFGEALPVGLRLLDTT